MAKASLAFHLRRLRYDGLMYITNRVVAHIPSHTVRLWYYRRCMKFSIGARSHIFMEAWFDAKGQFVMGDKSVINQKCRLDTRGGIFIGDNVSISAESCILTAEHDIQSPEFAGRDRPVKIDDYVFLGTRAMILPGVTIGKGAIVAAGAIVTKDVEPYTVVAGVPAKPIGKRQTNLTYEAAYCRLFY